MRGGAGQPALPALLSLMLKIIFQLKLKTFILINGIEFSMHDFFSSKCIIHQTTCIETPEEKWDC